MTQFIDMGGETFIVEGINVGATGPGQAGTPLSGAELTALDGAVAANTGTGKVLLTGTSGAVAIAGVTTFGANPTFAAGKTLDLDSATATLSSNAATVTKYACVVTTESLTTAHTATATFVITLTGVAAGDLAFVTLCGGTNTAGIVGVPRAVTTTDTITITVKNEALTTNAFNGTLKFNLWVVKA